MRLSAALVAAVLLAGCGLLADEAPDWVRNRQPLDSCGEEVLTQGGPRDVGARTCLLDAFQSGSGAEFLTTRPTVEGDPVTTYFRVHENGVVEIFVDASRDRFGSEDWSRLVCEAIVPVDEAATLDIAYPPDQVFVEEGCRPEPIP